MIDPTENFPEREYLTFSEKLEWARRLERIERVKAEERMKAGKTIDPMENFPGGVTRDIVATKSGFGSGKQYEKAKFIAENADPETIAKLDADEISIHRAWKETKARLEAAQRRYVPFFAPVRWRRVPFETPYSKNYRTMVQI